MPKYFIVRFLLILLIGLQAYFGNTQSIYTEFGKNRVQYHDDFDNWWMYETENFIVYWYGKGRNIAETTVQLAELDNDRIQKVLEHRFNDKIQIVVYTDITDMKQSNIGSEELFTSRTGRTKILENKIFVYFDGDHQALRQMIREGVAAIYLESMLYGSNLQEIVQNAVLLKLPEWFSPGLVQYLGQEWGPEIDGRLRDLFTHEDGRYQDFQRLARDYPAVAGYSMWYYLGRSYGKSSIANILYLSRIQRSLESAFQNVLGTDIDHIQEQWNAFFQSKFESDLRHIEPDLSNGVIPLRNKRNLPVTGISLSPNGESLAYVLNQDGKVRVYLYNFELEKSLLLLKVGVRNILQQTDFDYPHLAWSPDGAELSIISERRDVINLHRFSMAEGTMLTETMDPGLQRVYSASYWDSDTLFISANKNGYSDLFKYVPLTRQSIPVIEDFFDDLDAKVVTLGGVKGVLFRSNRVHSELNVGEYDTIVPIENFDIYFLSQDTAGEWVLNNMTETPDFNEKKPLPLGPQSFTYLSNQSGLWNRKTITNPLSLQKDVAYTTIYNRNIEHYAVTPGHPVVYDLMYVDCQPVLIEAQHQKMEFGHLEIVPEKRNGHIFRPPGEEDNPQAEDVVDERYLFQSKFESPAEGEAVDSVVVEKAIPEEETTDSPLDLLSGPPIAQNEPSTYDPSQVVRFNSSRAIAHRLRFKLDYVTTTLDNSLLFSNLDSYSGTKQGYEAPPVGILIKANVKDIFEDYVIEGGVRFPTTFNGSEYYLLLDNRKRRIDKRYALYRKTESFNEDGGIYGPTRKQYVTVIGLYRASYPIDTYRSIRATGTIRNDRTNQLATDISNLNTRIDDEQRIGLQLEYVFDNTVERDINLPHGTKYKVWTEVVKKFDLNLWEPGEALTFTDGFMTVLGLDFRHYQRLDRHTILATRFMAATSLGSERILYYLGGVENWMFNSFDNTVPVLGDENFAYQTIAANMRGFKYNARNGSSVALLNTELRIPFVRYLSKRKIKSAFLRNMQLNAFLDVGTAWHGSDPFSSENPLNTLVLTNPPTVIVNVKYFRNPIVVGYGLGVRTSIFGYFLKLDYGWGLETQRVNEPILYFSMGTDF